MLRLPRDIASVTSTDRDEKRRSGRLRCHGLKASHGMVLDLSSTGVLIGQKRAPKPDTDKQPLIIWIEKPDGERLYLRANLARSSKRGWRRHEAAYNFVDLTPEMTRALGEIARCSVRYEHGFGEKRKAS